MGLPFVFEFATDVFFKELANFITPPKAGRVTAIESNGQVRVDCEDVEGGDVLAWPLNGLTYAVDDIVYVLFAVNNPESGIVIGSKGATPVLDGLRELSIVRNLAASSTDAPVALIHQDHASDDQAALRVQQDAEANGLDIRHDSAITSFSSRFGSLNLLNADTTANNFSRINFIGEDGTAASAAMAARFVNHASRYGDFTFWTRGADGFLERLTILSNGRVGIGGTPSEELTVIGAVGVRPTTGNANFRLWPVAGRNWTMASEVATGDYALYDATAGAFRQRINSSGYVGWGGVSTVIGLLHAHDGAGGFLFATKTSIVGTAQVIIPNGTGDVTKILTGFFTLSDGTSGVSNAISMIPTDTHAIAVGGSTWTLTVAANGEFSVQRTAGAGSATMTFLITWI